MSIRNSLSLQLSEKRRRKAVFDWDYEPIDDNMEGKLWFDMHGGVLPLFICLLSMLYTYM